MESNSGMMGIIGAQGAQVQVESWMLMNSGRSGRLYLNEEELLLSFNIPRGHLYRLLGEEIQIRLDNECGIFYGFAKCSAISKPSLPRSSPLAESFRRDCSIHFDFLYESFGPYSVAEVMAMAKNGNAFFFDLLRADELETLAVEGDARFFTCQKKTICEKNPKRQ